MTHGPWKNGKNKAKEITTTINSNDGTATEEEGKGPTRIKVSYTKTIYHPGLERSMKEVVIGNKGDNNRTGINGNNNDRHSYYNNSNDENGNEQ